MRHQHKSVIKAITKDPLGHYMKYRQRLEKYGRAASFPEFADIVDLLILELERDPDIAQLAASSPVISKFRYLTRAHLLAAGKDGPDSPAYGYTKAIDAIERGVEFFDIAQRVLYPEKSPPLYHGRRYEYYMHYLVAETPSHIFFPTTADLGVTDLLKVRGVPIGFIGVNIEIQRVDGFHQTPYEFFLHDINHSRRMYQFSREEASRRGLDELDFYRMTNNYLCEILIPQIVIRKADSEMVRKDKNLQKMILFEILHEDAMPADPEVLKRSMLRPPNQLTPFERIEGDTVFYIMEPGATTLAYVYRKLAHTFYDAPEDRRSYIVEAGARSRTEICSAAKCMSEELALENIPTALLEAYVGTDTGFPDDFRRELVADISKRNLEALNEAYNY